MPSPTLIPEAHSYGVAIFVVYSVGSSALAVHVYARWLRGRAGFWAVRNGVLACVVMWGLVIFGPEAVAGGSLGAWIASIPIGLLAGWVARWGDRAVIRYAMAYQLAARQAARHRLSASHPGGTRSWSLQEASIRALASGRKTRNQAAATRTIPGITDPRGYDLQLSLSSALVGAILEELMYRGAMVHASFLLRNDLAIQIALVGTALAFALSHIQFGWIHVAAKLPLSFVALLMVLLLKTVMPAIVAHAFFNVKVWKDLVNFQPVVIQRSRNRPDSASGLL